MCKNALVAVAAVFALAACAPSPYYTRQDRDYSRDRYSDDRYDRGICASCGEVTEVYPVRLRDNATSGGGAVLGAIIGGVLGSTIGGGDGRRAATVAGAVAGGFAGNAVERDGNRGGGREAWRVEVQLDDGRWAEVTQPDHEGLQRGDRVEIRGNRVIQIR
ncbi:MAG: glycine zipper 2TM domain-containing protein [Dokdonella sp.]